MKTKTHIGETVEQAEGKSQYDKQVKLILSDKNILARILKFSVKECFDLSIDEIKTCIGAPAISTMPVKPTTDKLIGKQQEGALAGEGKVVYDISFDIQIPFRTPVKIIIDIEAQKKYYAGYDLVTRGVFYLARLLSSQLDNEFDVNTPESYDDIKKVYSIWICMDAPNKAKDTITSYSFEPKNVYGVFEGKARYDLATLVMIRLTDASTEESKNELIGMLSVLLSDELTYEVKESKLEHDYGIHMSKELKEGVRQMCNLSDLIEEKGIEKGIEKGAEQTEIRIATMMLKDGKQIDEILEYVIVLTKEQLEEIRKSLDE